jgi:predicted site-specific integrase-resolvase
MSKKVTLEKWAESSMEPAPTLNTLRKWAREGRICPAPVKCGRSYYVDPEAEYTEPERRPPAPAGSSLISRIESARHGAKAA